MNRNEAPPLVTRDALAEASGRHTPVWDADGEDFHLVCGCGEFEHGGLDRPEAERRFGDHLADALAPLFRDPATLADALAKRREDLWRAYMSVPGNGTREALAQGKFEGFVEAQGIVRRALAAALSEDQPTTR